MKLLTVIVPIYNKERLLRQCLNTLCIHDIANELEVLLIDDGSNDASFQIAKEYEEKEPEIFKAISKENGGVGSVMNLGLSLASGKYVKEIDADDWVDSNALIMLVKYLENAYEDIVINPFIMIDDDTGKVQRKYYKSVRFGQMYKIEDFIAQAGLSIQSCTIRREMLNVNKFELDAQRYYIDMQLIESAIMFAQNCVVLRQPLYCYRIGQSEQSVNINSYIKNIDCFYQQTVLALYRLAKLVNEKANSAKVNYQWKCCRAYCIYLYGIASLSEKTSIKTFDAFLSSQNLELYNEIEEVFFISKFRQEYQEDEIGFKTWVREEYETLKKQNDGADGLALFSDIGVSAGQKVVREKSVQVDQLKLINQWMINIEQGYSIEEFFARNGYGCFAIYGLGMLGEHLYHQTKNSSIELRYGVDQKINHLLGVDEMRIFKPDDELEEVDVIVVTAIKQFEQIKEFLEQKVSCDIVSIEDLIY